MKKYSISKIITTCIIVMINIYVSSTNLYAMITDIERQALIDLYHSTKGQYWINNDGWLGDKGSECNWFGIKCNEYTGQIIEIDLSHNNLSGDIQISKFTISGLKKLNLSYNQITNLPDFFGNLTSLIELDLSSNTIKSLPESFKNLLNLKKLNLSSNKLVYWQDECSLPFLEELNLSNNVFSSFDIKPGYFLSLKQLDISNNYITSMTIESPLGNLKELNLQNNNLDIFPLDICKQVLLQNLNISENFLTTIPDEIISLTGLKQINMSKNKLLEIPYHLGNITGLATIDLSNNIISKIGFDIPQYEYVQSLNLSGNYLTDDEDVLSLNIPGYDLTNNPYDTVISPVFSLNIEYMIHLSELNLSNCYLEKVPVEIGKLINLKSLDLSQNLLYLNELPEEMGNLFNLNTLSLRHNDLKYFPKWITNLKNLTYLDLSYNMINDSFPVEIIKLNKINYLGMAQKSINEYYENKITTSSPIIIEFLSKISKDSDSYTIENNTDNMIFFSSATKFIHSLNSVVNISMNYYDPITLQGGNLYITFETGEIDQTITIPPFSSSRSVSFSYTVQSGDFSNDLKIKSMALDQNASLTDSIGNMPLYICSDCNISNIYIDGTIPETEIIHPKTKSCIQDIEKIEGQTYDISGAFTVEVQLTDSINNYNPETGSWQIEEYWHIPIESLFIGTTKTWTFDTTGIEWENDQSYTINVKAKDFAGNTSSKSIEFKYGIVESEITCHLSKDNIVLGEPLHIKGKIYPPENVIDTGVSIELISPLNQTIYKSVKAQIDGSFNYSILCDDIFTSGQWSVRTSWAGNSCLMPAISNSNQLTVNKAQSEIVLDVMHDAIKYGDSLSISGVFTPDPNCGGDLSGIQLLLSFTNGSNNLSKIIYTSDSTGHFQLVNYMNLKAFGDWQVQAMVFDNTNAYETATSGVMTVRVVESAGYAILIQGKILKKEGLLSHKKTCNFVYDQLKQRGIKDDKDFDDIRFFYDFDTDHDPAEMVHVYEKPDKNDIKNAFIDWAPKKMNQKPANLYVILVDHGRPDTFYIDPDTISANELGQWLDTLQDQLYKDAMFQEIVVILGFCHSGSFINELSGSRRVIIASADENEFSYKGPLDKDNIREGEFFVSEFFKYVSLGKSVKNSFSNAVQLTERFTESIIDGSINAPPFFDNSVQHPLLDDNGDGIGTNDLTISGDEGKLSKHLIIGISTLTGNNPGDVAIVQVADSLFIDENNKFPVEIPWAVLDSDDFVSLWIEIKPPDYVDSDDTQTEQKELDLPKILYSPAQDIDLSNSINIEQNQCLNTSTETKPYTWTWEYIQKNTKIDFSTPGAYQIFYFAKDKDSGNVSPFKETKVYKNKENNNPPLEFNLLTPANGATVSIQGVLFECDYHSNTNCYTHLTWEDTSDPENDVITYSLIFSKNNNAFDNPCNIIRYDQINENSWAINLPDSWDGSTVYWKVLAIDQFGEKQDSAGVNYFLINNYGNPMTSTIKGRVTNVISEKQIKDVVIKIGQKSTGTNKRGYYFCKVSPGTYDINLSKQGYLPLYQKEIKLNQDTLTTKDFVMHPDLDIENTPPVISNIASQVTKEDETLEVFFNVHDETMLMSSLIITCTSSNTDILPNNQINVSGTSQNYVLTIKPDKDKYGQLELTVHANDGALSTSKSFQLLVEPVDDIPVISTIIDQEIFEDQSLNDISFSIIDVDNDMNNFTINARSSDLSIIKDSDIHLNKIENLHYISITPVKNAFGKSVITITVKNDDYEVSKSFNVTVLPVNDSPVIEDMTIEVIENNMKEFSLSAYDIDNDPLSYILISNPIKGNLHWKPPNAVYIPTDGACHNDYFEFIVNDGQSDSDIKRVDIIIKPKDCNPVVENISVETNENEPLSIKLKGNDISNNLDLTFEITESPLYGSCSVNMSSLLYTPKLNWSGEDRLKYIGRCKGCNTNISQQADIIVNVNNIDVPAIISPIPDFETDEDKPISDIMFTINDPDTSLDDIDISALSSNPSLIPNNHIKIISLNSMQVMAITPADNQWGESTIDLICNSNGKSTTQSFIVKVNAVDDAPFVQNPINDFSVIQNSAYTGIDLSNVFDDIDNDSQSIIKSFKINSDDDIVQLELIENILTIHFNKDKFGKVNIALIGTSNNKTAKTSFNITINKKSQPPVVSDLFITSNEDITSYISLADLNNCYHDLDNDPISKIRIKSLPDHGELLLNNIPVAINDEISVSEITSKSLAFKPNLDWNGKTFFLWEAFDSYLWSEISASINFTYLADPVNISTIMKKGLENNLLDFDKQDLAGFSLNYSNSQIQAVSLPENGKLLFDTEKTTTEHMFNGTVVQEGYIFNIQDLLAGELAFMPDKDFNGFTQFLWRASKDGIWSDNEYVKIEITPMNDPPTILNIAISGYEDNDIPITLQFFASLFLDVDHDELKKIRFTEMPSNGELKIDGDSVTKNSEYHSNTFDQMVYVPNDNFNGIDIFQWNAFDGIMYANSSAMVTITIQSIDDPPYVKNVINDLKIYEDSGNFSIDLSDVFDDIDNDNNGIAKTIISNNNRDLVSSDISNNTLSFDLGKDQHGEANIVIRGISNGLYVDHLFTVIVLPVDDKPVILNPISDIITDEESIINIIDLSEVFYDVDRTKAITISLEITNKNVIEANISESELSLVCLPDQNGETSVTVFGESDGQTISNTFKIIVNPINDPPVIEDIDNQVINEDSELIELSLIIQDVDTPLESLTITYNSDNTELIPNNQIILNKFNQKFSLEIIPYANMNGIANVNISVEDEKSIVSKSFKITVLPVNDAPEIKPLNIITSEGNETIIVLKGFDIDGDELSYKIVKNPEKGNLIGNLPHLIYEPSQGLCGNDRFTYQISDGKQMSLPESVFITITSLSCEPIALDFDISMQMNTSENIVLKGYEKSQYDLAYTILENPLHGILTGTPPNLVYTPDPNWFGLDEIKFVSSCGKCNPQFSQPAYGKINVSNTDNWAPVISGISKISKPEDSKIDFSFIVTDKDTAFSKIQINYEISSSELISEKQINMTCIEPNCFVTAVPNPNAFGIETIHITAFDGISTTNKSIELNIIAVDDPPILLDIQDQQTNEDRPIFNIPLNISDIDTDINNLLITFASSNPYLIPIDNIDLNRSSNKLSFHLIPVGNAYGESLITVNVSDDNNLVKQNFSLDVKSVNDEPVADSIYLDVIEDSDSVFVLKGFDIDGDTLNYSVFEYPQKGQLSGKTPNLIFTPNSGICGNDFFSYQVSDGYETAVAPVYITITALTCEPYVLDQTVSTGLDRSCNITLNGYELSQKNLEFKLLSYPQQGQLTGDPPYLTYLPESDKYGEDHFTYAAICGRCEPVISEPAFVTIIIFNENNAPPVILCKSNFSTNEDTPLGISFLVTDSDNNIEDISVSVDFNPSNIIDQNSLVCTESGCVLSITPANNAYGKTIINISANDNITYINKQIEFDIIPINDPPIIGLIPDLKTNEDIKLDYFPFKISDAETPYDQLNISIQTSNPSLISESNVIINDNMLSIFPLKNKWGQAKITINVSDNIEKTTVTFNVTVESVNDPPIAKDAKIKIFKTNTEVIFLDARDIDNEELKYSIKSQPLYGRLIGTPPYLLYFTEQNNIKYDSFSFIATDGTYQSNTGNIYITYCEDILPGDFDYNDRLEINDVILIYQILAGVQHDSIMLEADVNNDNKINIADAIYLMKGLINNTKNDLSLTNGLMAYYTFDGNANDSSGNNKHGELFGPKFATDRFGNIDSACSFDGVDDYLVLTNTNDYHFLTNGFTLSLWIKFEQYLQYGQQIIGKNNCAQINNGFTLGSFAGSLSYVVNGFPFIIPKQNDMELTIDNLISSGWHNIVCIYDINELKQFLYIDGILSGSQLKIYSKTSDNNIQIGGVSHDCTNKIYFHGLIDDVRIYNRPLMFEEIQMLRK